MSITAAISAGVSLGMAGTEVIVRYSKHVYDEKISELEGYAKQLETHLSTLEGYKNQVTTYWDDASGDRYKQLLEKEITAVKNSQKRVEEFKKMYTDISDQLSEQAGKNVSLIDTAENMLNALGIETE